MVKKAAIIALAAALGAGSSFAVGACGEDRGSVSVEDGTGTGGTSTGGTGTGKTGTTKTGTTKTGTTKTTQTSPTTETETTGK